MRHLLRRALVLTGLVDRLQPLGLLALRLYVSSVFFRSGLVKVSDWGATLALFHDEYKVPLLPPDLAANMAVSIEVAAPILLVAGLFTRLTALVLLGMTTVIEVFVYPQAWPTHIQWVAMLLVLLCRGPGWLSLDHLMGLLAGRGAKVPAAPAA